MKAGLDTWPAGAGCNRSSGDFDRPTDNPPETADPVILERVPSSSTVSPARSNRLYWLCQIIGWGCYALVNYILALIILHPAAGRAALDLLVLNALGFACSHSLRARMRAKGWAQLGKIALIGRIFVACAIGGTAIAIVKALFGLAPWQTEEAPVGLPFSQPLWGFVVPAVNWTFILLMWCAFYFGALALRAHKSVQLRESELARALQLSELRGLKSQLNPHYLFNALNTVRALIAIDPTAAQRAVTQLARTLRYTLGSGQEDLVTLEQELATVEDYLALEALRLEARLRIEWNVDAAARGVRIPVMLLQTLVENAIKHGIAELPSGGILKITAQLTREGFELTVANPCPNARMNSAGDGVGLRNATERLRHLFGGDAALRLDIAAPLGYPAQPAQAIAGVTIRNPQ